MQYHFSRLARIVHREGTDHERLSHEEILKRAADLAENFYKPHPPPPPPPLSAAAAAGYHAYHSRAAYAAYANTVSTAASAVSAADYQVIKTLII